MMAVIVSVESGNSKGGSIISSDRQSPLSALNLPKEFGAALLILSLGLLVMPYLSGATLRFKLAGIELGLPKMPELKGSVRRRVQFIGPICVVTAIAIHAPLLPVGGATSSPPRESPTATTTPIAVPPNPSPPHSNADLLREGCTETEKRWLQQADTYLTELNGIEQRWSKENVRVESLAERVSNTLPARFAKEQERINETRKSSVSTWELAQTLRTQLQTTLDRLKVEPCN